MKKKKKDGTIEIVALASQPKGMKIILEERGLWDNKLTKTYKLCKSENKDDESRFDLSRTNCCADRIIELQPDFMLQTSVLEETILKKNHKCIFLPKFHCELNFIEMFLGQKDKCDYKFESLKRTVPGALNSVPLDSIRRSARKSWRNMDIYRGGLTGLAAVYACKKFSSHRSIPVDQLRLMEEEYIINK